MYDASVSSSVYFELDTIGNVRRVRGGKALSTSTPLASDLGGYRFTAFGRLNTVDTTTPYPSAAGTRYDQPLRWQSHWFIDAGPGFYDFRARVWSPDLATFLQPDEYGFLSRTGTLWSWPGQNPFKWRDFSGRDGEDPINALQGFLDGLAAIPGLGNVAGPAAFGHGVRNRVEGTIKMSNDATVEEGDCQRKLGNAQIAAGGEATAALGTVAVGLAALAEKAGGIIYLRQDTTGLLKDYVGQAESEARYGERQLEHAADNPASSFQFSELGRADPGQDLNVAEEDWIRAGGGPTNKSNPEGGLSNARHQMNDADYRSAGGKVPWP
jgi:RHS repeat-associated protein